MKPLQFVCLLLANGLAAAADIPQVRTLGQLIQSKAHIFVIEVEKVDRPEGPIHFKKSADLKGKFNQQRIEFAELRGNGSGEFPDAALHWAKPGRSAVVFAP